MSAFGDFFARDGEAGLIELATGNYQGVTNLGGGS
jgi:hypothetical protein